MSLIEYLPAIYQDPTDGDDPSAAGFLESFLSAFERVILSTAPQNGGAPEIVPLNVEISSLYRLFDAETTPDSFLPWLANWVALALRADLDSARQRRLLANTARLYRIRGTRRGIEEVLKLYLEAMPSVTDEDRASLQIGDHSTVGADTYLGGGASFLFQVRLAFTRRDEQFVERQRRLARDVIELERPAHTWYDLETFFPKWQVGIQSTVGVDTVLAP